MSHNVWDSNSKAIDEIFYQPIEYVYYDITARLIKYGISPTLVVSTLNLALEIVLEANQQKGKEKDENGKVKKPKNFIKPEAKIKKLLEQKQKESILERERFEQEAQQGVLGDSSQTNV
jgi:hypothetical protein